MVESPWGNPILHNTPYHTKLKSSPKEEQLNVCFENKGSISSHIFDVELCCVTFCVRRKHTIVYGPQKNTQFSCTMRIPTSPPTPPIRQQLSHISVNSAPTATSLATIRPLGLVWSAVLLKNLEFSYAAILLDYLT